MDDDDDALSPSSSRSPPPLPVAHAVSVAVAPSSAFPLALAAAAAAAASDARIAEPITVAAPAPPHSALTLALPIQHPRLSAANAASNAAAGGNGREDAWSEGATSTLIDAWGERYMELSRGNLKQKHWQEVADAVTSRDGYTKTPKTDVQCKNRIDTLKKKYKNEKSKISGAGPAAASAWPFFSRLDRLLGPNLKAAAGNANQAPGTTQSSKIPAGVPIRGPPPIMPQFPQRHRSNHPAFRMMKQELPSGSSKSGGSSRDSSDGLPPVTGAVNGKRERGEEAEEVEEERRVAGMRELTQAILRFGEVYERVESSKLQQAMELEKQRLGFARELEVQRMQFFMKTQMELSQLKRGKGGGAAAGSHHNVTNQKRRMSGGEAGGSGNHHNHYYGS